MARLNDPNSATSQFFINLRDNHRLDFGIGGAGYAVFGAGRRGHGRRRQDRAWCRARAAGEHENVPEVPIIIRHARELASWTPAGAGARPGPAASKP